jgi:hypothetical protein
MKIGKWINEPLGKLVIDKITAWWHEPITYPWPEELNEEVQRAESAYVCHHCLTPQGHPGWFCPKCGAATGPYNNYLPYINIFSTGEVVRAGVGSKLKWTCFTTGLFILFSFLEYLVFAPAYWFRMYRNWKRQHEAGSAEEE